MQEHYSFVCDRNCAFADRYIRRSGRSSIKSWVCPFTCSLHTAKPIRTWNNQTRWHTLESEGNAILSILPVSKKVRLVCGLHPTRVRVHAPVPLCARLCDNVLHRWSIAAPKQNCSSPAKPVVQGREMKGKD